MANKNIQLMSNAGDSLFPRTNAKMVVNEKGENLAGVEAGANVNLIEKIKVNGVELSIKNKEVNIPVPGGDTYTIIQQTTPDSGYSATYQLTKNGVIEGAKINIPKDMVVSKGEVKICEQADNPVIGYKKGDKYLDLTLANTDNQHVYVLISDMIAQYGIGSSTEAGVVKLYDSTGSAVDGAMTQSAITSALNSKLSTTGTAAKATADAEGNNISATYATKIAVTNLTNAIDGKADKATTLAGYGITDGLTMQDMASLNYITYVELADEQGEIWQKLMQKK